jgi:hypothetical protein
MLELVLIATLIPAGFVAVYLLLKRRLTGMFKTVSLLDEVQKELDKMIVEINRITDRNVGLMEDKVGQLSSLLADAEKKIADLRREHEKYTVVRDLAVKLEKNNAAKQGSANTTGIREKVITLRNEGFTAQVIAGRLDLPVGEVELILSLNSRKIN